MAGAAISSSAVHASNTKSHGDKNATTKFLAGLTCQLGSPCLFTVNNNNKTPNYNNIMQINDKALLVKLNIGMPGNGRKDKAITNEVTANHALASNAGRWNKTLYPPEAFTPITTIAGAARTFHYDNTLPWLDDGMRILPTLNYQDYTKAMRQFRAQFESTADSHFIAQLAHWEDKARQMHNGTYRAEDYKPAHKLAKKFKFKTDCQPIPTGQDFRVKLSAEEMDCLMADTNARLIKAAEAAEADLWLRLSSPLAKLSAVLSDPEAKFKDTIVTNLKDICALVPKLNITANPQLSLFARELDASLAHIGPESLRHLPSDRAKAKAAADDILVRMTDYLPNTDE